MHVPLTMLGYLNPRPIIVQSPSARIPRLLNTGKLLGFGQETRISQANAITAIWQESLTQDWYNAAHTRSGRGLSAAKEYQYASEFISSTDTINPTVEVKCAMAQNLSMNVFTVNFPVKTWTERKLTSPHDGSRQWHKSEMPFNISTLDLMNSDRLQIDWVSLPTDKFGPVSGGIYVQFPMEPTTRSRAVVGCSISATWSSAKVRSNSIVSDAAWSIDDKKHQSFPKITMSLNASSAHARDYRRLITLKEHWYRSLTPSTPSEGGENHSRPFNTLQRLFSAVGIASELVAQRTQPHIIYDKLTESCIFKKPDPNTTDVDRLNDPTCGSGGRHQLMELILGSTFANGLSRYGSHRAFNLVASPDGRSNPFIWDLKQPPRAHDFDQLLLNIKPKRNAVLSAPQGSGFVTQRMHCEVFGYGWYVNSISDYLAIGVVIMYMLIAVAYTVWVVVVTELTSSSWDTVTELLTLALQSPVPEILSGSGAGVKRFATYQRLVRLRARTEEKVGEQRSNSQKRLVLIVGNETIPWRHQEGDLNVRHSRVQVDEEYS